MYSQDRGERHKRHGNAEFDSDPCGAEDAPPAVARAAAKDSLIIGVKYVTKFRAIAPNSAGTSTSIATTSGVLSHSSTAVVQFLTPVAGGHLNLTWRSKEERNEFLNQLKGVCGPSSASANGGKE